MQPQDAIPSSSSGLNYSLHPLVLINISDHHTRTKVNATPATTDPAKAHEGPSTATTTPAAPRVFGCLLGQQAGLTVDISNSFEVNINPENSEDMDFAFLHKKLDQYKQTYPGLDAIGWYATGSAPLPSDLDVHRRMTSLNEAPIFLLLDPVPPRASPSSGNQDLPVRLFESELHVLEGSTALIFVESTYSIATSEAERIGVDQVAKILPPGASSAADQLVSHVGGMQNAAKALVTRVTQLHSLLRAMADGTLPFDPVVAREAAAFSARLPAADEADGLREEASIEACDAMLSVLLAGVTKCSSKAYSLVNKHNAGYERPPQTKRSAKGDRYGGMGMNIGGGRDGGGLREMMPAAMAMGGLGLGSGGGAGGGGGGAPSL